MTLILAGMLPILHVEVLYPKPSAIVAPNSQMSGLPMCDSGTVKIGPVVQKSYAAKLVRMVLDARHAATAAFKLTKTSSNSIYDLICDQLSVRSSVKPDALTCATKPSIPTRDNVDVTITNQLPVDSSTGSVSKRNPNTLVKLVTGSSGTRSASRSKEPLSMEKPVIWMIITYVAAVHASRRVIKRQPLFSRGLLSIMASSISPIPPSWSSTESPRNT
mmetsp:Transcript_18450/g.48681  ORF Transcript_18450/g.48681 Transcript_18450/m.48681 type:complete len:218 (-) Transcript_18450:40-693(-)